MIESIVIVGFFFSIFFFFSFLKLWDLRQELKRLEKKKLNAQFRQCYHRGRLKELRRITQ